MKPKIVCDIDLYIPSRCTASLPEDLENPNLIAEEKLDGSRYMLYLGCDPYKRQDNNALLSRRVSVQDEKHVDRTRNVPHITGLDYEELIGTVLDGEIMAKDFLKTNGIMNCGSEYEAVKRMKEYGYVSFYAFDVVSYRGQCVKGMPLAKRRKILEAVVERMDNEYVKTIPQVTENLQEYFQQIVDAGGEGIIVKDTRFGYGREWSKFKKSYDVSCVISGYKEGNGKYAGGIGSLALSVWHDGKLHEIGFASGMDDALRNTMSKNFDAFEGKVVDVYAQEIQDSKRSAGSVVGRLRHPTFHRLRDDLNSEDCTFEKLKSDMKAAKTKAFRKRGGE